jgi:hypothetical protein
MYQDPVAMIAHRVQALGTSLRAIEDGVAPVETLVRTGSTGSSGQRLTCTRRRGSGAARDARRSCRHESLRSILKSERIPRPGIDYEDAIAFAYG